MLKRWTWVAVIVEESCLPLRVVWQGRGLGGRGLSLREIYVQKARKAVEVWEGDEGAGMLGVVLLSFVFVLIKGACNWLPAICCRMHFSTIECTLA